LSERHVRSLSNTDKISRLANRWTDKSVYGDIGVSCAPVFVGSAQGLGDEIRASAMGGAGGHLRALPAAGDPLRGELLRDAVIAKNGSG
jgi:hypothetical protein